MPQPALALSLWLHSVATVVLIGHYLLLSLVYLPYLSVELDSLGVAKALAAISRRLRPWLSGALLIFIVTGVYLTMADQSYLGVGQFGNAWSALMLVKHVVVLGLIGLIFYLDAAVRRATALPSGLVGVGSSPTPNVRPTINAIAALGVIVLLLTAIAQAA